MLDRVTPKAVETPGATGLILAAAGGGSRFGGETPKQFLKVDAQPLYLVAFRPFIGLVDEAIIVVPSAWQDRVAREVEPIAGGSVTVVPGGVSRQESVWKGLRALSPRVEWVLVHDAARPFLTSELVKRVLQGAREFGACIPAVPPHDTVKELSEDRIRRTIPRGHLAMAQTPQGFRLTLLDRAFELADEKGLSATDEAQLVEWTGLPVHVVPGEVGNIKVTWSRDLPGRVAVPRNGALNKE